ncbi:hypothetical protein MNEG_13374 [Monoraphidium neglectum]|uniref:Uncharacterized protein n=1 Tax=Monoraphidium neglectum TaxID=145388 RepID=A0A0D2KFD5_9CHLO|nr:hypothetical protein MNEG_13374 [Monoraphidium neglectum]KIY94588.1 hypothetical protein MNEG_13374 [Monoraphidium neglectum]|eukprot:XP_013893608.1 hypothetical protein MNEG_13374 [Monoraphidium neglectum]
MATPPLDAKLEAELKAAFYAFASFGSGSGGKLVEMEGKSLIKLCKVDCKLMGKALTTTDIDLIFAKGCSYEEVVRAIVSAGGPVDGGTKAEAVRLHDDKTCYTGVYAKGGPTNVDMDPSSLASLCDRSPADARGVKVSGSGGGSRRATSELIGAVPAARRSTGESGRAK